MDVTKLERAYKAAKDTSDIKAIVVIIIPGNPTGQVLKRENLEAVIKFAAEKKLFVFADEVIIDHEDDILEFISTSSGISAECLCRRLSFAQFQEGDDGDGCSLQPAGGGQLHVVVNPPSPVDVVTADDATTEEVQGYYTVDICCSNVYCSTLGKYIVYIFICPEIVTQIFYLLYFVLKNCQYLILLVLKPPILHWSWGGSLIEFKGFQEKGQSVVSQYIAMAIFSHNPTTPPPATNPPKHQTLNWSKLVHVHGVGL